VGAGTTSEAGKEVRMDSLVSTDWLAAALGSDDLRVIDASYFLSPAPSSWTSSRCPIRTIRRR
jgi:hypothetical protein